MIWMAIFVVASVGLFALAGRKRPGSGAAEFCCGFGMFSFVVFLTLLLMAVTMTWTGLCVEVDYARAVRDGVVYQTRSEKQRAVVLAMLGRYPMEKNLGVYGEMAPRLLLKLPEIKSDALLTAAIEQLVEFKDKVYETELRRNELRAAAEFRARWFWVPTFRVPVLPEEDE